jgi:dihydrofolate synthase/folylpolyglutamate synthase
MRTLLDLAGTPQSAFDSVLVAGTKGKGSMAALLTSVLDAAGYGVGRYTQPHLYSHRERIWAAGDYITGPQVADELAALRGPLATVERHADDLGPLTAFDVGTALALGHFARAQVDVAVIEVGVGGANDATNALEPMLALVGPVGMDHADTLGHTLEAIAWHKAGVMRAGIDVVSSRQEAPARAVIQEEARRVGARLSELGDDFDWRTDHATPGRFSLFGPRLSVGDLQTPLLGPCQRDNAAVVVTAAQLLRARGYRISDDDIRRGLAAVSWPGRFQIAVAEPFTIVDGAHNQPAMRALADTIHECVPDRPITLVVGMSSEKDVAASLAELAPTVSRIVATRARHPRACPPERIAEIARELGLPVRIEATADEAVQAAWRTAPDGGVTLVSGSLFLVGDVLEWLWRTSERAKADELR